MMKPYCITILVTIALVCACTHVNADINDSQCGPESLLLIAHNAGIQTTLKDLNMLAGTSATGTTMLGLLSASEKLDLPVVPVELTPEQYRDINAPMIAWVDGNHYVVVWECKWFGTHLIVQDPPGEKETISVRMFTRRWNGEALIYSEKLKQDYDSRQKALQSETHPGAHVFFNETVAFAGTVNENETIHHEFTYKNTGIDTLRLYARSSCACMAAFSTDTLVPPGGTGQIDVKFDTSGRHGHTQQSIDVRTNDVNQPWVKLTLAATVRNGIKVLPSKVWLDDVAYNSTKNMEIRVLGSDDSSILIKHVKSPSSISVIIGSAETDSVYGRSIPVSLSYHAGLSPITIDDVIEVEFESGQSVTVPVEGRVIGPYRAKPPVAYFDTRDSESELIREIVLLPTGPTSDSVYSSPLRVESTSSSVSASIDKGHAEAAILRVKLHTSGADAITDTLQIYTPETDSPSLIIPVFALGIAANQ